ncbi:hypothetical protein K3727_08810 [Rhodobacteraceae bacterium M382]|nr:hypothetical protein K3727_08810 [Rhodobacteraceae bacterium M382]
MQAQDRAGLKFAMTKHENSGGVMAKGTWHVKGTPGAWMDPILWLWPLALERTDLSPVSDKILRPLIQSSQGLIMAGYDPIDMRVVWRDITRPKQLVIAGGD